LCLPISPRGHSVLSLLYLSFINTQQPKPSLDFLVGNRWAIRVLLSFSHQPKSPTRLRWFLRNLRSSGPRL